MRVARIFTVCKKHEKRQVCNIFEYFCCRALCIIDFVFHSIFHLFILYLLLDNNHLAAFFDEFDNCWIFIAQCQVRFYLQCFIIYFLSTIFCRKHTVSMKLATLLWKFQICVQNSVFQVIQLNYWIYVFLLLYFIPLGKQSTPLISLLLKFNETVFFLSCVNEYINCRDKCYDHSHYFEILRE